MKKIISLIIISFCLVATVQSQQTEYGKALNYLNDRGEVYFTFEVPSRESLLKITKVISVDGVKENTVTAFANRQEFTNFLSLDLPYTILPAPSESLPEPKMYTPGIKAAFDFNSYPTYEAYVALMNEFATTYPSLCQVVDIGGTVQGRRLLFVKISDNIQEDEGEPRFMYTSSMHGDETAGYVMMLRLINYLLSNYQSDQQIANLVDNLEIWINPLANPDGTYRGGNNTVSQATRSNANNIDLNRNYPDMIDGDHPDGRVWQPETQAFMSLAEQYDFVMAANFHGGAEVVNYPWDNTSIRHPEDAWFQEVCREYADLAQVNSPSGYMEDLNNGITNGYDWYPVAGGRQDYMNHYFNCREVTIELSGRKLVLESQFESLWNYNYPSLLAFMNRSLTDFTPTLPGVAANPAPSDNSTSVSTSASLTWNAGSGAKSHDIYFGTSNPPPFTGSQNTTTYSPENMAAETTYYWRVDEKNDVGTTAGPVWTFTTGAESPYITAESESNNSAALADGPVGDAVDVSGAIGSSSDADWFHFTVSSAETINISVEIANSADLDWYLYRASNTTRYVARGYTVSNPEAGSYNAAAGEYYLKIVSYDGIASDYTLTVSGSLAIARQQTGPTITSQPDEWLKQNYPNPAADWTTIPYHLPKDSRVDLSIYDLSGNLVLQLINKFEKSGEHQAKWDIEGTPPGLYIYKLTFTNTDGKLISETRQMIISK